jgi:hypothetical protein
MADEIIFVITFRFIAFSKLLQEIFQKLPVEMLPQFTASVTYISVCILYLTCIHNKPAAQRECTIRINAIQTTHKTEFKNMADDAFMGQLQVSQSPIEE